MTFDATLAALETELTAVNKDVLEAVGVTGYFNAILGTPEGVVVDDDTRREACMWCHIEGQTPFLAKNTSSELTWDNSAGGLNVEVKIGFPAGQSADKDRPSILGLTDRGRQALGGITPGQAGLGRSQNPQAERLLNLRITKGAGMTIGMTGGWYMIGLRERYAPPQDNIADLTAYIPATAGYSKYCTICWDGAAAIIVDRGEFDPAGGYIPYEKQQGSLPGGTIRIGHVLLENGMSTWEDL